MSGFIDYSHRKSTEESYHEAQEERPRSRAGSRRSNRSRSSRRGGRGGEEEEKDYGDLGEKDLEREAQENHDEPVGDFMGDRHRKAKEGFEESYVGGTPNPFGSGRAGDVSYPAPMHAGNAYQLGRHYAGEGDQQAAYYSGGHAEEGQAGYYEAERRDSTFGRPTPVAKGNQLRYNPQEGNCLNEHHIPNYPTRTFVRNCFLEGFQIGSFLTTLASFNLVVVMSIAAYVTHKINPFSKDPPRGKVDKEWETRISGERFSSRMEYYANYWGYECEDCDVETEDGFVLRVHHLTSKKHKSPGHPVILQHGILSNGVTFAVNEERSLAFWLLEQGYDVFVSNIRTNFEMPHRQFKRSDPRYWAWAIKEIGIFDLPAIVDYVGERTGYKPTYIGHSQGTGTMFLALSQGMRPDLGEKVSGFVALGPAVYGGPVLRKFPFSLMRKFKKRWMWSLVFGVREFIPIISILQQLLPSWLFGHTAFPVFAFIFGFHDHNWVKRQIPKFFRTIAVANPSELLYYYMSVLSYKNCIFDTHIDSPWFPETFPPLAIYYGTLDTLVLGRPLVERIRSSEPNVPLVKVVSLENYEHLDMLFGVNAVEDCYYSIREFIEETKNGYKRPEITSRQNSNSNNSRHISY